MVWYLDYLVPRQRDTVVQTQKIKMREFPGAWGWGEPRASLEYSRGGSVNEINMFMYNLCIICFVTRVKKKKKFGHLIFMLMLFFFSTWIGF